MHEASLLHSDVRCFSLEKQFPHTLNQHIFPEEYLLREGTADKLSVMQKWGSLQTFP